MPDAQYKRYVMEFTLQDGTTHQIPFEVPIGESGGFYTPSIRKISDTEIALFFTPSKGGMPSVAATIITIPAGQDYVLTDADKVEIAEMAAEMVESPGGGGSTDLTGYATEQWVKDQKYLSEVPKGYATEEFVKSKIDEAELGGGEVDLGDYALKSEIPNKVSQLQNDSGFLTAIPDGYAKTEDIPKNADDIGAQPSGDYPLRSELPTKVSELINDSGYLTQQDIGGKLDASKLPEAINEALALAKASGEFDGEDGYSPVKGKDYFDGKDGYSPVRGTDYWTDSDIAEIKSYVNNAILGGAW